MRLQGRLALPLVVVGILAIVVVGGRMLQVSKAESKREISAACTDAGRLRTAHLLNEAMAEYAAIDKASKGAVCPAKAAILELTAAKWRRTVIWDLRTSAEYLERARVYRRAARLKGAAGNQRGVAIARSRARSAYLVALYVDPGATVARRELGDLLRSMRPTTGRTGANRRCALAGDVFAAGLLPEARMVFAQALRSGRTTECAVRGVRRLRTFGSAGARWLLVARGRQAADEKERARAMYIAAFHRDDSLSSARTALATVPASDLSGVSTWPHALRLGSDVADDVESVATWISKNPDSAVLAVLLVGAACLLVMWIIGQLARGRRMRRFLDRSHWFHRYTRLRVNVAPFDSDGDAPAATATDVFTEALTKRLLIPREGLKGDVEDLDATTELSEGPKPPAVDDWAASVPALATFAGALRLLASLMPRDEVKVTGRLLSPREQGPGLRVQVTTRRGRPMKSRIFWHREILPCRVDDRTAYLDLARYAAPWVHDREAQ